MGNAIHQRIWYHRGKAVAHECADCDKQARDWSWIHDTDPEDIYNYVPRCRGCHNVYDGKVPPIGFGEQSSASKLSESDVVDIKRMLAEGKFTQKDIAYIFKVSQSTITNINVGKVWEWV